MESDVSAFLQQSAEAAAALANDATCCAVLADMARIIAACLQAGGKLLVAGNGGSAADAQHVAAEYVSRLMFNRAPLAALALSESGPVLTACGNDYGFATVFARQVTALGRAGDVLLGLSTSGNSPNLLEAATAAREAGMLTLGLSGRQGGEMLACYDHVARAPSDNAQLVQQLHVAACHAMLAAVERHLFGAAAPA